MYINKMILLLVKANIDSLPACFSESLSFSFKYISCIYFSLSFFWFLLANIQYLKKAGSKQKLFKITKKMQERKKRKNHKIFGLKKIETYFCQILDSISYQFLF